jgi:oxygen-dependent protoporphyrinogen oxidase
MARSRPVVAGKARAAVEPLLPRAAPGRDEGDTLGPGRPGPLGDEVLDCLVGPLIGGINAGDPDRLSLRARTPRSPTPYRAPQPVGRPAAQAERFAGPSGRAPASPSRSRRWSILVEQLRAGHGAAASPHGDARSAERRDGRWRVQPVRACDRGRCGGGHRPAPDAATLLGDLSPEGATALRTITAASVAMITLAVPEEAIARPITASGYLVPRSEQRTITACSWGSSKWAEWRVPGQVVLRISAGRDGDERALDLGDDDLLEAVLSDLDRHVGLRGQPTANRITRWLNSMPQYAPGHVGRVDALTATLARDVPGLWLAGAAFRGLGLPACIAQGRAAARAALATVGQA